MMKPAACLPLLLALCLPWPCASQTISRPSSPADSTVCLPAAAARRIDATLTKYPRVLRENELLRQNEQRYAGLMRLDSVAFVAKDTVIAATTRRLTTAKVLGRDAEHRAAQWKNRARARFWFIVGETALLLGGLVLAAGR